MDRYRSRDTYLHLTTFCLQYQPTVVACCCIYLACKWAKYLIPRSNEGREWFHYVDQRVTNEQIEELYQEFISILNKCPAKLKKLKAGSKSEPMGREVPGTPSMDMNHAPSPTPGTHHDGHTSHDRRDPEHGRHGAHVESKVSHGRPEHHRDLHPDKRKDPHKDSHSQAERKPSHPHHQDAKTRKDNHREGKEGHSSSSQTHRKDAQHSSDQRERHHHDSHKREVTDNKRESDVNGGQREHTGSSSGTSHSRSHPDLSKLEQKLDSPSSGVDAQGAAASTSGTHATAHGLQKMKSETSTINLQEYMKRKKEREHQERERREQERKEHEERKKEHARREQELRQKLMLEREKRKREADLMNKTFSEGSSSREQKHRPPKLDVSLPLMEHKTLSSREGTERPYEVNIKSPIKPHHNITVKSPIKSSDLKQPKLEIPKVQLTPDKDGSDPTSVNINMDPAIRKLIKQEPSVVSFYETKSDSIEDVATTQVKEEPFSPSNFLNMPEKIETVVKSEPVEKIQSLVKVKSEPKEELEPGEIDDSEVDLLPEHSAAPSVKIKELGYDPERGLDSAVALKHQMKHESGSGKSTPVTSHLSDSGANTPLKVKIKLGSKGVASDSDHSSSKHSSPHRHKHKHKEKHKHKHRDRDKHRERHHDKAAGSGSANSTPGTNGQSLKMSFNKHSGSEKWAVKQEKQKHKGSVSDPALTKHAAEHDRQQPWSLSSLTSISEDSNSRKRRRTPTVDQGNDQASASKAPKVGRSRSSSNHSVVSMDMSDGEEGNMIGPPIQTGEKAQPYNIQLLNDSIRQIISQKQRQIESMQHSRQVIGGGGMLKKPIDRQQSGFDLDGMMWAGNSGDMPPLPMDSVAPPPPPPPPSEVPPPPPSH